MYTVIKLRDDPAQLDKAAHWFHEKWGIDEAAYRESMEECLKGAAPVPQWYLCTEDGEITGGMGVIENDFHDRKDLAPNVCAVFTEEAHRGRGIAGRLLAAVCEDMAALGVHTLYLLTDHDSFYERYGWEFYCMAQGDGEDQPARLYRKITE